MDIKTKEEIKGKVLKNYELYKIQHSRLKRLLKAPFKTIPFYILSVFARIHPFKMSKKTLWGKTMSYYLPEGNAIYYFGFYEANLTNFIINILNENDIFIDIGAHVGTYSSLASTLVSPAGKVFAFEPTPRTYQTLTQNISSYQYAHAENKALLDTEKKIEFIDYGPANSVFNTFKKRTGAGLEHLQAQKIEVQTSTLDLYLTEKNFFNDLENIKSKTVCIKVDAEGAESLILKGADRTLKEIRPVITIEVGAGDEWKENNRSSIAILKEYGYECFEIDINGKLSAHTIKETYEYDNLVFIHHDKVSTYKFVMA